METNYRPYQCRDDAVEEYKSLRNEIIESQKQRISLLQYSLVFIGALFGYLYKDSILNPIEALLLIAVSIPCALFSYATRCRERRIAQFIGVFMKDLSPWSVISPSVSRLEFAQRTSTSIVLTMVLLNGVVLFASYWTREQWVDSPLDCIPWFAAIGGTLVNIYILRLVTQLPNYEPALRREKEQRW